MHVRDLKPRRALGSNRLGSEGGQTTLLSNLRERVGLIHELDNCDEPKELTYRAP